MFFLFVFFPECKEFEFTCHNSECVPTDAICDGIANCNDSSDEWNCTSTGMLLKK